MTTPSQNSIAAFGAALVSNILGIQAEPATIDENGHTLECVSISGSMGGGLVVAVCFFTITDVVEADKVAKHVAHTNRQLAGLGGAWGIMTTMTTATTMTNTPNGVSVTTQGSFVIHATPPAQVANFLVFDDEEAETLPQEPQAA